MRVIKPDPPPQRYIDLDEHLAGRCMTCRTVVSCTMRDVQTPKSRFVEKKEQLGAWTDLVSAECPTCGARVFVMPAQDFEKLLAKEAKQ